MYPVYGNFVRKSNLFMSLKNDSEKHFEMVWKLSLNLYFHCFVSKSRALLPRVLVFISKETHDLSKTRPKKKKHEKVTSNVVQSNCVCRTFCTAIPELISVSLSRARMHSSARCFTCEWQERFTQVEGKSTREISHKSKMKDKLSRMKYSIYNQQRQRWWKVGDSSNVRHIQ